LLTVKVGHPNCEAPLAGAMMPGAWITIAGPIVNFDVLENEPTVSAAVARACQK